MKKGKSGVGSPVAVGSDRGCRKRYMLYSMPRVCWLGYRNLECVHTQELCFALDLRGCRFVCDSFMWPRFMAIGGRGWIVWR